MEYVRLSSLDLSDSIGKRVNVIFMVKALDIRPQKNGGEFITLIMKDRTKEKEAKIFGVSDAIKKLVQEGLVYKAQVDVSKYDRSSDGIGCVIYSIEASNIRPEQLADWSPYLSHASDIVGKALSMMNEGVYKDIAYELLYRNWDKLVIWVGGKSIHHTELGSLLTHTAEVVETAIKLADIYNGVYGSRFINMDLLIAGALLHDIGKIKELDVDISSGISNYSINSLFMNHIVFGVIQVHDCASKLGYNIDSEEVKLLEHVICAHHGKLEYGSPVKPAIPEATIVSISDGVSAEMWIYNRELSKLSGGEASSSWSNGKLSSIYKEIDKGKERMDGREIDDVERQCNEESRIVI